ncbi:MAG: tetratricopeptide repeat protein [Planctomycetaceae bacterium]
MNADHAPLTPGHPARQPLIIGLILAAASLSLIYDRLQTPSPTPAQTPQTVSVHTTGELQPQKLLQNARQAATYGDWLKALRFCEAALQLPSPDNVDANLLKADLLFQLHRHTEMQPPLELVLQQDPNHATAHTMLAHSLRLTGDLETALTHVNWCLTHQPHFLPARRMHAEILRDQGETDRAIHEIRDVIALGNAELDSHLLLAELLMYQRRFDEALKGLLPLRDAFASNHRYVAAMARLCQVLNHHDDAAHYRTVLQQLRHATAP